MNSKGSFQCSRFQSIAIDTEQKNIIHLRCKQWDCAYCAKRNAMQWRAGISASFARLNPEQFCFLTFTLQPQYHSKELSAEYRYKISAEFVRASWDKLMKRLKREYGAFEYVRVLEQHKSGTLHVHVLATFTVTDSEPRYRYNKRTKQYEQYYHSDTIKKHATECDFGYIHDARNLTPDDTQKTIALAVSYVLKYMTKHSEKFQQALAGNRVRKIQTSRGIKKVNIETDNELEFTRKTALYLTEYQNEDSLPYDMTAKKKVEFEDFGGELWQYPRPSEQSSVVEDDEDSVPG